MPHRTKFQADHRPREWLRAGELRRHPVSPMLVIAALLDVVGEESAANALDHSSDRTTPVSEW
ncbi:MAG: hypothetical protein EBR71_12240 [Planctomycetes bacterium]|nr:hypothetical protein [Planctomycetota bacterium]